MSGSRVSMAINCSVNILGLKGDPKSLLKEVIGLMLFEYLYKEDITRTTFKYMFSVFYHELTKQIYLNSNPKQGFHEVSRAFNLATITPIFRMNRIITNFNISRSFSIGSSSKIDSTVSYRLIIGITEIQNYQISSLLDKGYHLLESFNHIIDSKKIDKFCDYKDKAILFQYEAVLEKLNIGVQVWSSTAFKSKKSNSSFTQQVEKYTPDDPYSQSGPSTSKGGKKKSSWFKQDK